MEVGIEKQEPVKAFFLILIVFERNSLPRRITNFWEWCKDLKDAEAPICRGFSSRTEDINLCHKFGIMEFCDAE